MIRRFFIWLHRWTGLAMAAFLIVVGLTGSLLALRPQIEHLFGPQFYAKPQPGAPRLSFAALTDRAEALIPQEQVYWIVNSPDQIRVSLKPRLNSANGRPYPHEVDALFLNPWTGRELARLAPGELLPATKLIYTVIALHDSLCLGSFGYTFIGIIAIIWTIDCFVAFYLTLPATIQRFWPRWQQAWLVKWRANARRVNYDLHRAGGLWLWPLLFVFAWSGVMFNLPGVYHRISDPIFKYEELPPETMMMGPPTEERPPGLNFRNALSTGERLMADQGRIHGFTTGQPGVFQYEPDERKYYYSAHSSRDVFDKDSATITYLTFDCDTGALRALYIPTGEHMGNTVFTWLVGLHQVWVFGLPYRIMVCVLGLVIAMLSYTGIYIWWKKRRARMLATAKVQAASASSPAVPASSWR